MSVQEGSSNRRWWLVVILTLLALIVPMWAGFEQPGMPMDEGMTLLYPELVLHGAVPYRDFETYYGPGNLWTLASAYAVFGVHLNVERTVGLIYRLFLFFGIMAIARRWGVIVAVTGAALAALVLLPTHLIAYAWLGGVACALWSIVILAGRETGRRAPMAGFLAAAALLFRQDLGLAVIGSAIPLVLLLPARQRWHYAAGFAAGLLPMAALTVVAGPGPVFENLFLYPVIVTNGGRRLPLSASSHDVVFMFWLHIVATVLTLAAGIAACCRERRSVDARLLLSAALLALGLTHQCMQRADVYHIVETAFFSVALAPIALLVLARLGGIECPSARNATAAAAVTVATVFAGSPGIGSYFLKAIAWTLNPDAPVAARVTVRGRTFPWGSDDKTGQILRFLETNSKPGERLFVGTGDLRRSFANDTFIYHLLPWLTPATYFLEMNPLSANRPGSRLADDVASADWLVLNHGWDNSCEPNLSTVNGSDRPNEVVRSLFEICARAGKIELYRRKNPAAATVLSIR